MSRAYSKSIGISAIATYEPPWILPNAWFAGSVSRKFEHHTGIRARQVSTDDEVTMAERAVENLRRDAACDLRDCAAIIFASPSFVPMSVARKHLGGAEIRKERLGLAARNFAHRLGLWHCPVYAINWFCSGYAKALSIARGLVVPTLGLELNQFILVVTSGRISRITDYGCPTTAALFGDMATATLVSRLDSPKYRSRFKLLYACAQKQPAPGVYFDFELRKNVLAPLPDGGKTRVPERLVFSLDGLGIADAAPRAMSAAVLQAIEKRHLSPDQVRFVVPHQAGSGIIRLASMKFEQDGIQADVINGLTSQVGNVSSCSIPYAIKQNWQRLDGIIACPTAAVGAPGQPEISQGCILLEAIRQRDEMADVA